MGVTQQGQHHTLCCFEYSMKACRQRDKQTNAYARTRMCAHARAAGRIQSDASRARGGAALQSTAGRSEATARTINRLQGAGPEGAMACR